MSATQQVSYPKGFLFVFSTSRRFGSWIPKSKSGPVAFLYKAGRNCLMICFLTLSICMCLHLPNERNLEKFIMCFIPSVYFIAVFNHAVINLAKQDEIVEFQEKLKEFFYLDHLRAADNVAILESIEKIFVRISKFFWIYNLPALILWFSMPFTLGTGRQRLPILAWVPYDYTQPFIYEVTYIFEYFMGLYLLLLFYTNNMIPITFIFQLYAQYRILEKNIKELDRLYGEYVHVDMDESKKRFAQNLLKNNIRHHQAIVSGVESLDEIYNLPMLNFYIGYTISISSIGFYCITASGFQILAIFPAAVITMSVFLIFCLFASLLLSKSEDIAEAAYASLWYEKDPSFQRQLGLMVMRAQKPPEITAGKLIPINIHTFVRVLEITYDTIALFRQFTQSERETSNE